MLIVEIILFILCVVALFFAISEDEAGVSAWLAILATLILFCFILDITGDIRQKKSLKDYSYRVEIKSEVINGIETSRDTVYIFTPKKK